MARFVRFIVGLNAIVKFFGGVDFKVIYFIAFFIQLLHLWLKLYWPLRDLAFVFAAFSIVPIFFIVPIFPIVPIVPF